MPQYFNKNYMTRYIKAEWQTHIRSIFFLKLMLEYTILYISTLWIVFQCGYLDSSYKKFVFFYEAKSRS